MPKGAPSPHGISEGASLPRWLQPRVCVIAALALSLLVLAAAGLLLSKEASQLEQQALNEASLYARVLAEQVNRSLDATEAAMRATLDSSARVARDDQTALSALLAGTLKGLNGVRSISLLDEQGRVYASSNPANVGVQTPAQLYGTAAVSGRSAFGPRTAGRDLADLGPAATASRQAFLPMTLTDGGSGDAARAVMVALNPDQIATAFELLLVGTDYAGALLQLDAKLITATELITHEPGVSMSQLEAFTRFLPRYEAGRYLAAGLNATPVATAFRSTRLAPWVTVVEREQSSIRRDFQTTLMKAAAISGLLLLLVGTGAALGYRGLQAYAHEQAARQQAFLELQQQLALNARLIEANLAPIYVKDDKGVLLKANQAWFELTGLQPEQTVGRVLLEEHPALDPEHPQLSDARLMHEGGRVVFDARLQPENGPARDVVVSKAAYRDGGGHLAGLVGSLSDVTAYQDAKRAAEKANEVKTEFLANISHELRTPLQSILGYAELGKDRFSEPPRVPQMFERIHSASVHMLSLVNNLLDLARSDLLVSRLAIEARKPLPLIDAVVQEFDALATQRGQKIQTECSSPDFELALDPQAFQQVIRNLLANALRFAPSGGLIEVRVLLAEDGAQLIQVLDRGPGIPEDELELIFEPFQQSTRTKDGSGGTGLGLAISRRILQALGASIVASNREGGGACFELRFPPATGAETSA